MSMERLVRTDVDRHKAAIIRSDLSRPVKVAVDAGFFQSAVTFFDYGCGHGGDIERVSNLGIAATGWDPYFRPDAPKTPADIVNLGYVLNVIENPNERKSVLQEAWDLTKRVLIVSAQVLLDYLGDKVVAFGDGVLTKRNTFQKVFKQEELKEYIDSTLSVAAVPAGLGIYFVFRQDTDAESFRASRFHSRRSTPRVRLKIKTFEESEEILRPLMDFVSNRGRIPLRGELPQESELLKEFGSINRAFKLVVDATSKEEWEELIQRRKQDFSLYIALSKFGKRPRIGQLPLDLQNDIKAFFGSYKAACDDADHILFSLGQPGIIAKTCAASKIGKALPDALYVHISALDELDLILRLYEGCASRTVGRMDGATLIKFHVDSPKISYLFYPDFDTDPHPALETSMRIDLRDLHVKYSDYSQSENPPVLHRKETFVAPSYPLYEQFSNFTSQEEAAGLLSDAKTIGTRHGWERRLKERGFEIHGHQLHAIGSAPLQRPVQSDTVSRLENTPKTNSRSETTETLKPEAAIISEEGRRYMNTDELKQFIQKGMSINHVYQPAILLALFENGGQATLEQAAQKCAELEGKPAENYTRALGRYPIEALSKRGVITRTSGGPIKLNIDWDSLSASTRAELSSLCRGRLK